MSESRGLTLRKKKTHKRPVISTPKAPEPSQQDAKPKTLLQAPGERPAATETSDLIKRRYSTRYNQLPNFGDAPDVPALPAASNLKRRSAGGSPRRPQSAHANQPLKVDQDVLSDPNLQPERYATQLLSNASEEDIQEYQHGLRRIKHRTSTDLQQSVYQNRTQFIKISKEAEKLKSEMGLLRGLMSELTTALGQSPGANQTLLNELDPTPASRRHPNRSSVANLEAMWSTQLQALWKQVEKSQKFLPAVPGRHVLMETGNWIELDSATWKPKRPVHIVLLNDHLLVASKKRKRVDPNTQQTGPAPTKLVAEECWPLQDVDLVDVSANLVGSPNDPQEEKAVATAVAFRSGGRTLTYRHEKRDTVKKAELLTNIRKAVEDLRKASVPQGEQHINLSKTDLNYLASRDPASAANTDIMDGIHSSKSKPEILIEVDGRQQNFRWVEGQLDELDIDIALQRFQVAVEKVEKLRAVSRSVKNNVIAHTLISLRVDERAASLATVLCRELIDTPSFLEYTKKTTSFLIRLGFEDRAREAYLSARSDTLTKRARQCVFDGDLHKYVFSISYVYFTIIKNTVLIFQASFSSPTMSACIKWANDNLEIFNALLVRQLSSVDSKGQLWRDCMDVVWEHEREMLAEGGLDFREVIGRGLEYRGIDSTGLSTSAAVAAAANTVGSEGEKKTMPTGAGAGTGSQRRKHRSKSRSRDTK